jgi:hypothetical protein
MTFASTQPPEPSPEPPSEPPSEPPPEPPPEPSAGPSAKTAQLVARLEAEQRQVMQHPVYRAISPESLPMFMEHHVFAVLDFMWLLKALQRRLTSTELSWTPVGDPVVRRLINEIVLGEESDEIEGRPLSHFELYLEAMDEAGADTGPVRRFADAIDAGVPVSDALDGCGAPEGAVRFTGETWRLVNEGSVAEHVGAFAFGREQIIPEMFSVVMGQGGDLERFPAFRTYLERHIEVDAENHGPMAMRMVEQVCADDPEAWRQVEAASLTSLAARCRLWDAVIDCG